MTKEELKAAMKNYLAKGKFRNAVEIGMKYAPDRGFYDSLVIISGRLHYINRDTTLSSEERSRELAIISTDLLNMANELDHKEEVPHNPLYLSEITKWPTLRTERLVQSAGKLLDWGLAGTIRQNAAFSSFSLPKVDPERNTQAWESCFYENYDASGHYYQLLWQERQKLETHAQEAGFKLLISPNIWYFGESQRKLRLQYLLEFIEDAAASVTPCEIVLQEINRRENTTMIGNFLLLKSHSATTGGFRDTLINTDHQVVTYHLREFENRFYSALRKMAKKYELAIDLDEDFDRAVKVIREKAVEVIKGIIAG